MTWAAQPDVQKGSAAKPKLMTPTGIFMVGGTFLLAMLAIVPIWNATALLHDFNYVFWAGRQVPTMMIVACVIIVVLYCTTTGLFACRAHQSVQTEQSILMIGNIFITLFGLFLMMSSIPLSRQAELTSGNLLHSCDYSEETHRVYEYSQVLQNIRATPACAAKVSIEECDGYQVSQPYTGFLKSLETNFRCSGFCYRPPAASKSAAGAKGTSLIQYRKQRHIDHVTPLSLATESSLETSETELGTSSTYPPTLFSNANFQASCDGMAARGMKNFAGDVGSQSFYQGVYLVLIAIVTGFLKLLGFCVRKA